MMKHEFERLAGYEVSAEDYNSNNEHTKPGRSNPGRKETDMRTIVWEPMTDSIYGEFENLDAAKARYNIVEGYDFFEVRGNELWIALVD